MRPRKGARIITGIFELREPFAALQPAAPWPHPAQTVAKDRGGGWEHAPLPRYTSREADRRSLFGQPGQGSLLCYEIHACTTMFGIKHCSVPAQLFQKIKMKARPFGPGANVSTVETARLCASLWPSLQRSLSFVRLAGVGT